MLISELYMWVICVWACYVWSSLSLSTSHYCSEKCKDLQNQDILSLLETVNDVSIAG